MSRSKDRLLFYIYGFCDSIKRFLFVFIKEKIDIINRGVLIDSNCDYDISAILRIKRSVAAKLKGSCGFTIGKTSGDTEANNFVSAGISGTLHDLIIIRLLYSAFCDQVTVGESFRIYDGAKIVYKAVIAVGYLRVVKVFFHFGCIINFGENISEISCS